MEEEGEEEEEEDGVKRDKDEEYTSKITLKMCLKQPDSFLYHTHTHTHTHTHKHNEEAVWHFLGPKDV